MHHSPSSNGGNDIEGHVGVSISVYVGDDGGDDGGGVMYVCVFSFDCAGVLQIVPLVWSELAYINNATILSTLVHVNI